MIVGISGTKGAGKDYLARRLNQEGFGGYTIAFAKSLKTKTANLFGLDVDALNHNRNYKTLHRTKLQQLGTLCRSFDPDFWIKEWVKESNYSPHLPECREISYIIPDVRLLNEAQFVKQHGILIQIRDPSNSNSDPHESETEQLSEEFRALVDYDFENLKNTDLAEHVKAVLDLANAYREATQKEPTEGR